MGDMLYLHGESLEEMASPLKERMGVYVCSQSGCKMKMPTPPLTKASLLFWHSCACSNVTEYFTNYDSTVLDLTH